MVFIIFTGLCDHHHYLISVTPERNPLAVTSHFPSLQPLADTNPLSVSGILPVESHTMWLFVTAFAHLAYVFKFHLHQLINSWIDSIFWVSWIMLLWKFVYEFLCGRTFSSLLAVIWGKHYPCFSSLIHSEFFWLPMCVFSKHQAIFLDTNWRPVIQLNFDTICLELVSDPTR